MPGPGKKHVLRLYRHLLRYGNRVELTDKTYFLGRIKSEFKKNKELTDPDHIEFALKKGESLLRRGKVI